MTSWAESAGCLKQTGYFSLWWILGQEVQSFLRQISFMWLDTIFYNWIEVNMTHRGGNYLFQQGPFRSPIEAAAAAEWNRIAQALWAFCTNTRASRPESLPILVNTFNSGRAMIISISFWPKAHIFTAQGWLWQMSQLESLQAMFQPWGEFNINSNWSG